MTSKNAEDAAAESAADQKNPPSPAPLPFLLEFFFTTGKLVVLLSGVLTTTLSLLAGVEGWIAALRGGVAIFVVGLLMWLINWVLGRNALNSVQVAKPVQENILQASTIEREA